MSIESVDILGVKVTSGAPGDVVALLDDRIADRTPTRVAFLNAHLSNLAASDAALARHLERFLVLNDGVGVGLARRAQHGSAFAHNLNGTDLTPRFLDDTRHQLRLFLLGGRSDVNALASRVVAQRWPRHCVIGGRDGYFGKAEAASVCSHVAACRPDVVLVGLGNPLQEAWIAEYVPGVSPCALAIGAWFDFLTGRVPRAPRWVRHARLEWAFRLGIEPVRLWRRYLLGNAGFLVRVARNFSDSRRSAA